MKRHVDCSGEEKSRGGGGVLWEGSRIFLSESSGKNKHPRTGRKEEAVNQRRPWRISGAISKDTHTHKTAVRDLLQRLLRIEHPLLDGDVLRDYTLLRYRLLFASLKASLFLGGGRGQPFPPPPSFCEKTATSTLAVSYIYRITGIEGKESGVGKRDERKLGGGEGAGEKAQQVFGGGEKGEGVLGLRCCDSYGAKNTQKKSLRDDREVD